MKKLVLAIVFAFMCSPAFAQSIESHQANITSTNNNIAAGNEVITLTAPSRRITIKLSSGSSSVHVNFGGAVASTSNFLIDSGAAYTYVGEPIKTFAVFGNGAVGTKSIAANN